MNRRLIYLPKFTRASRKYIKKNPQDRAQLQWTLNQLNGDAFHSGLNTHKLKGKLAPSYSCSLGYDSRIIFEIDRVDDEDVIILQDIGTHDQVYD